MLSVAVLIRELRRSGRPRGPGQQAFPAWRLANRVGSGKSTVGRPKTSPSWLKLASSRPKLVLLGASGAASGLLGRSWPLWGCSWGGPGRLLVRSWRLLGCSWTDLGPLQTSLGSLLGPPGPLVGPLGPLLAAKSSFSRKPRSDLCFAGPIWPPGLPSWPEVGRSWPKLAEVGPKLAQNRSWRRKNRPGRRQGRSGRPKSRTKGCRASAQLAGLKSRQVQKPFICSDMD